MVDSDDSEAGAPADAAPEVLSRATVRAIQGVALALGAPTGWFGLRLAMGVSPTVELTSHLALYGYLLIGTATAFGGFGYLLGRREDDLTRLARQYRDLSIRDELTGLYNSRHFWDRLEAELHRAGRQGEQTGLLLLDLDHFKRVNDQWGHPFGDRVLETTGEVIRESCRRSDLPARVGGEEFAVLLPETETSAAREVGDRIRHRVEAQSFEPEPDVSLSVTLSVGVAVAPPDDETDPKKLYALADEALYDAKRGGRNLTETSSELEAVGTRPETPG